MDKAKKEAIMNARTFDELLDAEYGKAGTPEREKFDADDTGFAICPIDFLPSIFVILAVLL